MRLDAVTAEIRPRGDMEAVDLGFALARRDFWRCWVLWWMAMAVPTLVFGWLWWDRPLLAFLVLWWFKVAGERMVLYQLSRRLFGEEPSWRTLWREVPRAWVRRFGYRMLWARLSPMLPLALAVEDLEGLRGAAYRKRMDQLLARGGGTLFAVYSLAELAVAWFGTTLFLLLVFVIPEGVETPWLQAMEQWDPSDPFEIPLVFLRTMVIFYLLAMSFAEVWLVGAAFGLYVNTRAWIEGWDVEIAFRRLAQRLSRVAGPLVVALALLVAALPTRAAEAEATEAPGASPEAVERIKEVKNQPDFVVHKERRRVRISESDDDWVLSGGGQALNALGTAFTVVVAAALAAGLAWLLWSFRHLFVRRGAEENQADAKPKARVVMGMAVTPESLPPDLPQAAWALWQAGHRQEALGLLYRGTIARVIEQARVEILEADTEGDCLRRVEQAGSAAHPEYFRGLTRVWIRLAYAGLPPDDAAVFGLCQNWPFGERREA